MTRRVRVRRGTDLKGGPCYLVCAETRQDGGEWTARRTFHLPFADAPIVLADLAALLAEHDDNKRGRRCASRGEDVVRYTVADAPTEAP